MRRSRAPSRFRSRRAFLASRFRASAARSVLPVRVAGSISSLRPQFSATTSRCSLAATAAASASSYRPSPLQRTARAYALMASPMPSPRAFASRSVVSIRSVVSLCLPCHAERINAPYGADRMPVASWTDSVSETVAAAAARSPQNTRIGVRALRASASSLSVPVSRAISTLERESESACSSSQISRARTQPCHSQRSRSLAEASLAGEPLHRLPAARDRCVVVVGEGDQRVQQQVGGGRLGVRWARRGAGGLRDLGYSDAAVQPGAEQRRGERVDVRLARERDVQRLESAGGGQQERGRVGASAGDERELGLQQVDLRALELFERPGVAPWPAGREPR